MGFITNVKNIFKPRSKALVKAEMLNGNTSGMFTSWNGGAYANDIYREGVDAIARNVAKLKGTHVITYGGSKTVTDAKLNRLLQVAPNQFMSAYDMLYKLTTHYYLFNNCFAYLNRNEKGDVVSIYPITCTQADFLTDGSENLYIQFHFKNGKEFTASLVLDPEMGENGETTNYRIKFELGDNGDNTDLKCPACGRPLHKFSWGYGCTGYKDGCRFSIGKIAGKMLSDAQIKMLIEGKELSKIEGFKSRSGKEFSAGLKLATDVDDEGETIYRVEFLFDK